MCLYTISIYKFFRGSRSSGCQRVQINTLLFLGLSNILKNTRNILSKLINCVSAMTHIVCAFKINVLHIVEALLITLVSDQLPQ